MSEFKELEKIKKRMRQGSLPEFFKRMKTTESQNSIDSTAGSSSSSSANIITIKKDKENEAKKSKEKEKNVLGSDLNDLNTMFDCTTDPTLQVCQSDHIFLVNYNDAKNNQVKNIRPYPSVYKDEWDDNRVRMPCSPFNLYPTDGELGCKVIEKRWELIKKALSKPITTSKDLETSIKMYNQRYVDKWNFQALHCFFRQSIEPSQSQLIFTKVLPKMMNLALNLPKICTQPPPLLQKGRTRSVTVSQKQIACLLANAFFCTFPRRNTQSRQAEYSNYPSINFINLFNSAKENISNQQVAKLKCIFHYFHKILENDDVGCVTFHRQSLNDFPDWSLSDKKLCKVRITCDGTIEDDGVGMLQVDFANKFVGGGVLSRGCVQEEIRFLIYPELIISRLFTEALDDKECLIVTGCQRFSAHKGYADKFAWCADYIDNTPKDCWNRRMNQLVAIDATYFKNSKIQYQERFLRREINKAYCGFYVTDAFASKQPSVATGNWGCGVFRGDPRLKFILQLMAASECNRDVVYFTFSNGKLSSELYDMYSFVVGSEISIGALWKMLLLYAELNKCRTSEKTLYSFLYEMIEKSSKENVTSIENDVDML